MRTEFKQAITANQKAFGMELEADVLERLADFYELVQEHNPLLHLVGPASPEEFAIRHILESLTLLEHLPLGSIIADIGAGAGLPSVPCLIARDDLSAVLIESRLRKAEYLETAVTRLDLTSRASAIDRQFEEVRDAKFTAVTCRALDKFIDKLPRILKWAKGRPLYFFGGPTLAEALKRRNAAFDSRLIPMSEQRFLYVVFGDQPAT